MDRNDIIKLSSLLYLDSIIPSKAAINLIIEYCREYNKKESDITKLIEILAYNSNNPILESLYKQALEYYEIKFNICKLYVLPKLDTSFISVPHIKGRLISIF